jgi:hypothetical protein
MQFTKNTKVFLKSHSFKFKLLNQLFCSVAAMVINNKTIFTIIFLIISMFVYTVSIKAQDIKKETGLNLTENIRPSLNEHKFTSNTLVDGPFINTFFRLTTGIGSSSNYDLPSVVINGKEINGLFGQIQYGVFNVKYQQKINNWLAFAVGVNMAGRLGSERISLITEGINIGSGYNFGWIVKAYESKKVMMSASLRISNNSITLFNLTDFIEKIIQNGGIEPGNKLVKTTNLTAGLAGFRFAYAFNRTFGCIGKINLGYGESFSSQSKAYFDAGVYIDADLNPKLSVPIGLAVGYGWNNFSQSDVSLKNPQNILFKINYTGTKDFDLGVEMNTQFFKLTRFGQDINLQVLLAKASIAYFF